MTFLSWILIILGAIISVIILFLLFFFIRNKWFTPVTVIIVDKVNEEGKFRPDVCGTLFYLGRETEIKSGKGKVRIPRYEMTDFIFKVNNGESINKENSIIKESIIPQNSRVLIIDLGKKFEI